MAKIALFCETYHESTRDLAYALHSLRHEVILVTSRHAQITDHTPYRVLTYFKKWSALEAFKFIPNFIQNMPDVWHFVFSEPQNRPPNTAQVILASIAKGIPKRIIMSSYFSVIPRASIQLKMLNSFSNVVTFGAREDLMSAKRSGLLSTSCLTEVMPPLPNSSQYHFTQESQEEFMQFLSHLEKYFLVWAEEAPAALLYTAQKMGFKILAKGPRNSLKNQTGQYFLPEGFSQAQLFLAIEKSKGMICNLSDLDLRELQLFKSLASNAATPLMVSSRQHEALPGLCLEGKTGWVINSTEDLAQLINSREFQYYKYQGTEEPVHAIQDSAINDLNRLMTKALAKAQLKTAYSMK